MKTFFHARGAFIVILILLQAVSCKKEQSPVQQYVIPSNLKMISSGYATGAATRVEVYAANSLFTGYNNLYIALYDSVSNTRITQAQISLAATVKMGTQNGLTAPVENPATVTGNNGLFAGAAIFTQASANWALTVNIQTITGSKAGSLVSAVSVVQPATTLAYSALAGTDSLFVALIQPTNPQLGVNSFELAIYKQVSALSFAPDSTYSVSINPQMPSMTGMNSPNNVNPVYQSNGHYQGKVDFIMSGYWQINISLLHNGSVADSSHYFSLQL